jgi:hypothetical protein
MDPAVAWIAGLDPDPNLALAAGFEQMYGARPFRRMELGLFLVLAWRMDPFANFGLP